MRKKSILMVCITALVALAMFVGCDNAPVYPSFVVGGSVDQTGDFLIGQKFDPSKFSVSVRYSDGSTKTLKDTSIVTLQGDGDTVSTNSVVEARLGLDYDNVEYVQTAGVSAYAISALEVTGPETVTADTNETAFTVTAKYLKNGAEMTMVLNSQEFEVSGFTGSEEDGTPVVVKVTPTLEDNKAITASYNAVFSGKSTVLPEDAVVESIAAKFVEDFSVNKLNYGAEAPAIDGSKIEVTAKIAGDTTAYDVASSDVEFTWVDAQGLPLIDYNFIDNNVSTLYVKASFDGCEAVTGAVDVFPVTVSWQNAGFKAPENIYAGDELPAIEGIRYTWTANGKSGIIPAEDVELVYAYATGADGKIAGSVKVDEKVGLLAGNNLIAYPVYKGQAASEDGNGIYLGYVEAKKVTVESVEFSMVEDWKAPAKQYYDALPTFTAADAIEKYIVTKSDGTTEEFDGSNATFSAAYYLAEGEPLSDAKATKDGDFDALANVDTILVGVTYGIETYYSDPIALTAPDVETVVLSEDHGDVDYYGAPVNWTIKLKNTKGVVDPDYQGAYTAYVVVDSKATKTTLPEELTAAGSYKVAVVVDGELKESTAVNLTAGYEWYELDSDFAVTYTGDEIYIDEALSIATTSFTVSGYTYHGTDEDAKLAAASVKVVSGETVSATNTVYVTVTYTGKDLKEHSEVVPVDVNGTSWGEAPTSTLAWADDNTDVGANIPAGRYNVSDFVVKGYKAHGDAPITISINVQDGAQGITSGSFEAPEYKTITFSYSFVGKDGEVVKGQLDPVTVVAAPATTD